MTDFRIALLSAGSNPASWTPLVTLLPNAGKPLEPDWTFELYPDFKELGSGGRRGVGFPHASWAWNYLKNTHEEALRAFCPAPNISYDVYIKTPTNESSAGIITMGTFQAKMLWMPQQQDKQANNATLGLLFEFRHLIVV